MHRSATILTAAALLAACVLAPAPAAADDIIYTVPTQFSTIQAALDQAYAIYTQPTNTHTFTVLVEPGTYPGGISLKPYIQLRGRETTRTILSGGGSGVIITAADAPGTSVRNFTFRNAATGILASATGTQKVTIENNVFSLGTDGVGIRVVGLTNPSSIVNNTFYLNKTAIVRDADTVTITNNIFSQNNAPNIAPSFIAEPNINYNAFDPDRGATEPRGLNFIPNVTYPDPTPLFTDAAGSDFHLKSGSPCINLGDPILLDTKLDSSRSDMGAYGGPNTDAIPARVKGALATATTPSAITVSWTASSDYAVGGYKVYYGRSSGTYDGTDAIVSGVTGTSPVDAGSAVSLVLDSLAPTPVVPSQPVLNTPLGRNEALILIWSPVSGATSYRIHYGIAATTENTLDVGNVTTHTLTGLTNGQIYKLAISAVAQATYYINVTAYDISTQAKAAGSSHESAFISPELSVAIGPANESTFLVEVTGMPEPTNPLPNLPNTGCFIATAAYGSPLAPSVQALREFRDRFLATNAPGSAFIAWYYANGPAAARYLEEHPALKPLVRAALMPVVAAALYFTRTPLVIQTVVLVALAVLAVAVRRRSRARNLAKETIR